MSLKALELTHRPCQKRQIDVSQQRSQRRWRVSPVIRDPTPKQRIELLGNVGQRPLRSTSKVQLPNRRPHGLQRRDADRGIGPAEQRVVPALPHQTGVEGESQSRSPAARPLRRYWSSHRGPALTFGPRWFLPADRPAALADRPRARRKRVRQSARSSPRRIGHLRAT